MTAKEIQMGIANHYICKSITNRRWTWHKIVECELRFGHTIFDCHLQHLVPSTNSHNLNPLKFEGEENNAANALHKPSIM